MTAQEHLDNALAHVRRTTRSWEWYIQRVLSDPSYRYRSAEWYKAGQDLELWKRALAEPAPPPPPPPSSNALAQSWLILGQDPELALNAPMYYKLAVTADPAYRSFLTTSFLQAARAQGRTIYSWCDSKPSGGTPPSVAIQVMRDYGLDGWMGEGESATAFDNVLSHGGKVAVVNLSALRSYQLQAIKERRILVTVELYRNCNGNQLPDWKNVNEGVGGNCIAVYRDSQCGGMGLARYLADGMFVAHRDSVYGPQMTANDYRALP